MTRNKLLMLELVSLCDEYIDPIKKVLKKKVEAGKMKKRIYKKRICIYIYILRELSVDTTLEEMILKLKKKKTEC